jgi:GTP:adenosylcobinamide-phosphate guanylyltransferase
MPKKLRPTVDLMAFKCRTIKVNIHATYWKVPFLIVSPDMVILTAGFLSQISDESLKCTLNLATLAPFQVFLVHNLLKVIPFDPT